MKKIIRMICFSATTTFTANAISQEPVAPSIKPPGHEKTRKTKALEAGAQLLQSHAPLKNFDTYLVGFHPMKEHPEMQIIAHHYCHQMNQDFSQCVLFDGNTSDANLHGVEYIISEKLFENLPVSERQYWHPHNGEILSGDLVAPDIPLRADLSLMKDKMNSYGKTWHLWNTGHHGQKNDSLPLGEPMLAWSFNRFGEALPGLIEKRDNAMQINSVERRADRNQLRKLAKPQSGVDVLKDKFSGPTQDIPGVVDAGGVNAAGD